MKLSNIELRCHDSQTGLRLYSDGEYLFSYTTLNDCIMDLVYHFNVDDLDTICKGFSCVEKAVAPFKYRGICSELFEPTDAVCRYVFYSDTLSGILSNFEKYELRAVKYPNLFSYGVQGVAIHLFNSDTHKYEFWLGGNNMSSVSDIVMQAKEEKKFIPDYVFDEFKKSDNFDVFISHKSADFKIGKQIYDLLLASGRSAFLSEISLPALTNTDYSFEIDEALNKAKHIIVVATKLEYINSGWVKYEWTSFANEIRSGRKNGHIITLNCGLDLDSLPFLLRQYEVIDCNNLEQIIDFLPKD